MIQVVLEEYLLKGGEGPLLDLSGAGSITAMINKHHIKTHRRESSSVFTELQK